MRRVSYIMNALFLDFINYVRISVVCVMFLFCCVLLGKVSYIHIYTVEKIMYCILCTTEKMIMDQAAQGPGFVNRLKTFPKSKSIRVYSRIMNIQLGKHEEWGKFTV